MSCHWEREMNRNSRTKGLFAAAIALAAGVFLGIAPSLGWASPAGAAFTTFVDAAQCLDGNNPNGIDCNNYASKDGVYMSGGPTSAGLSDGCYYFSVLVPGYQNGGFIYGATGNLSDNVPGTTAGDLGSGDVDSNRIFRVQGQQITEYPSATCGTVGGTHLTGTNPGGHVVIQLSPYDDTSNSGGVYILAVCQVNATSPSQCKYDMFKIKTAAETCPPTCPEGGLPPTVTKDAAGSYDNVYTWTITKTV